MSVYRTLEEGGKVDWRVSSRLFGFALPHRQLVLASIGIMVVASVTTIAQPYLAKLAMDEGIIAGQPDVLTQWICAQLREKYHSDRKRESKDAERGRELTHPGAVFVLFCGCVRFHAHCLL